MGDFGARILIVNADDFGASHGINAGIIRAVEHGVVTSASLMVRGSAVEEAVAFARCEGRLGLGLHLDLGEWHCVEGAWRATYEVVDRGDVQAVEEEIRAQYDRFVELVGRAPSHIDSHQHVHRREPVLSSATALAESIGVPLRHVTARTRYCGSFYGQSGDGMPLPDAISVGSLLDLIAGLTAGITELCCHPALYVDFRGAYRSERLEEVQTLCDPSVRQRLADDRVVLSTFAGEAVHRVHGRSSFRA